MPVRNSIDLNGTEWTYSLSDSGGGYYITYVKADFSEVFSPVAEIEAGDTQSLDAFLSSFAVR